MSKHAIIIGSLVLTAIYFAAVVWVHYGGSDSSLASYVDEHHLNSLGDFLAGVFSPLAFLWLTATVLIQSNELALQRKELTDSREVMKEQAKAAKEQAEFIGLQTQAMRDQIEIQKRVADANYKASLLGERFTVYRDFLEYRNNLLELSSTETNQFIRLITKASLLFGDEMAGQMVEIMNRTIEFGVELEFFEHQRGEKSFVGYLRRLQEDDWNGSQIDADELEDFKDKLLEISGYADAVAEAIADYEILSNMRKAMSMEKSLLDDPDLKLT